MSRANSYQVAKRLSADWMRPAARVRVLTSIVRTSSVELGAISAVDEALGACVCARLRVPGLMSSDCDASAIHLESTPVARVNAKAYLAELTDLLASKGNPRYGAALRLDRGSNLEFFGVDVPTCRRVALKEFSLKALAPEQALQIYDHIWRNSPHAEVMSVPLLHYHAQGMKIDPAVFTTIRHWVDRVDHWAHCDGLAGVISYLNHRDPTHVMPYLVDLNRSGELWKVRTSIAALVHYSGKNAVYLTPRQVFPLLTPHLSDANKYIANAVGWVLREMHHRYPSQIESYVAKHTDRITNTALRKARMTRRAGERGT